MSEKQPISDLIRETMIEAASGVTIYEPTELLARLPELLAIVEAAKACTYGHDVTTSATVGPCALCALNTALRAAGEEPTR